MQASDEAKQIIEGIDDLYSMTTGNDRLNDDERALAIEHLTAARSFIERLTKPSPEAMLLKLADDMLEAARYTVSDPDHVRAKISNFQVRLEGEASGHIEGRRLSDNLYVGSQWLAIQPSIAEGHLRAAAFELKEKAGRLRPRAD